MCVYVSVVLFSKICSPSNSLYITIAGRSYYINIHVQTNDERKTRKSKRSAGSRCNTHNISSILTKSGRARKSFEREVKRFNKSLNGNI